MPLSPASASSLRWPWLVSYKSLLCAAREKWTPQSRKREGDIGRSFSCLGLLCNVIWNTILRSGLFSAHTFYWSKADLPNMHSGRIWQEWACTHTHTHTHTQRADTWQGYSNQIGAKFDLWGKVSGLPCPSSSANVETFRHINTGWADVFKPNSR